MKKLNRKGFTLIELLAVIVILAIVLVVTIPNVINSMESARKKSFDNAIETIRDYVQKNYDICNLGADFIENDDYDSALFNENCTMKSGYSSTVIANAGYSINDIADVTVTIDDNDKVTVSGHSTSTGKFKGANNATTE